MSNWRCDARVNQLGSGKSRLEESSYFVDVRSRIRTCLSDFPVVSLRHVLQFGHQGRPWVPGSACPRICSTGRISQRADPDRTIRGGVERLLRTLHERIRRYGGTVGLSRSSTLRSIMRTHGCPRTTLGRIRSVWATVCSRGSEATAQRGPKGGSVPVEPVAAHRLARRRRRHQSPSEDMVWSTMGQ